MAGHPVTAALPAVFLVKPGHRQEELRYSLRTLNAYVPHERVVFAGYRPRWATAAAEHLDVPIRDTWDRYQHTTASLRAACERFPGDFALWHDDMFALRPVMGIPIWRRTETLHEQVYRLRDGAADYRAVLERTIGVLAEMGHDDPASYEIHTPWVVRGRVMAQLLDNLADRGPLAKRTLYSVLAHVGGTPARDPKVHTSDGPWDRSALFVSTNDASFGYGTVGRWLRRTFREPSPYEQTARWRVARPVPITGTGYAGR